jgi:hypothetical protein
MAYTWFDFRTSSGYISDGTDGVWNGGGNGVTSTLNGLTGSWNADRTASTENNTTSFGPRLAGSVSSTVGGQVFTIDGFTGGVTYPCKICVGKYNAGTTLNAGFSLINGDNSALTGATAQNYAINDGFCADAAGNNNISFATMQSTLGTAINITPSSTSIKLGKSTNNLYVMAIGFDLGSPAIITSSTAMMMGV